MKSIIEKLTRQEDLTESEMMEVMGLIMSGKVTSSQIAGFLVALRMKGETVEEIIGSAKVMKNKALNVEVENIYAIDTCGTGGDGGNTFNVSTAVAFVAAAAGIPVIKHGNRSVSSRCGSADVLEELGININFTPMEVEKSVQKINIGFMYAPNYHGAMKYAVTPRKELGIRTIFNILGPLTNPANVRGQVLGVFDPSLTPIMAEALRGLGVDRAMVVHGLDGLDEITITTATKVTELKHNIISNYNIEPERFGFPIAATEELKGGTPQENAEIILNIFKGEKGSKRNMVLINAGAAIYVGKGADSLEEGIEKARKVIDTGLVLNKLTEFTLFSQGVVGCS